MKVDPIKALADAGITPPVEVEIELEPTVSREDYTDQLIFHGAQPDEVAALVSEKFGPRDDVPGGALSLSGYSPEFQEALLIADASAKVAASSGNPKDAIGDTKPDLSLVPQAFNLLVSQAMMDGARKYGPYNWRENPVRARVYIAAAMRHLGQYLDGENIDPISGVYHIGHAGACLAILADALTVGNLIDDRPIAGQAGELIRRFGETKSFKPE